jgi:YggT family protein
VIVACPTWGRFIVFALGAYYNVLFLYIIFSLLQSFAGLRIPEWLRPAVNFVFDVCEPFLRIFRGLLPPLGVMDLSPILGFFSLLIVQAIVARLVHCA